LTGNDLYETVRLARQAQDTQLENLLYHRSGEVLTALLENPHLKEQHLMILLARRDLTREVVTMIAQDQKWMKSYPLRVALLQHPRTPRHVSLRLLKLIFPFDLLKIAVNPGLAADLRRLIEDTLLARRDEMALGQRVTLARQGSCRLAGGSLDDPDARVIRAALDNPTLTEPAVVVALQRSGASEALPVAVMEHRRWSQRRGVKLALLRNTHLSLARFAALLPEVSQRDLKELMTDPRVAPNVRSYLAKVVNQSAGASQKNGGIIETG
jgi:hypothetical protein